MGLCAKYFDRPKLFDYVRKNLEMMSQLFHEDWSVVTTFSNRQDGGTKTVPVGIAESFFSMGQQDQRGDGLSIADHIQYDEAQQTWTLTDEHTWTYSAPGYVLPLGKPVGSTEAAFTQSIHKRDVFPVPALGMTCKVTQVTDGFDLNLHLTDGVPDLFYQVECCFAGPGT